MITSTLTDFRLHGEFVGFVRTPEGKKRMALRSADGEVLLKVERELRRKLAGRLERGSKIEVTGVVRTEIFTGESKRVVTQVHPLGTVACTPTCTIRICAKKNCWKQGGRELFRALEAEIATHKMAETVRLKAVGCLDECKHAPNMECDGQIYRRCSPADAPALVKTLAAKPATSG